LTVLQKTASVLGLLSSVTGELSFCETVKKLVKSLTNLLSSVELFHGSWKKSLTKSLTNVSVREKSFSLTKNI